jgi:hypothetical protein
MVQELLDPHIGEWSEGQLNANFESVDIHAILQIPIGGFDDDIWAWHLERHGNFTVRSAYRALIQANEERTTIGREASDQVFWKKLWKMKVPPKVRNFWWRVIRGFIPCRSVLKNRHIDRISFCQACGCEETIWHALFECTWAKLFWQEIKEVTGVKIPELHPTTWTMDLIDSSIVNQSEAVVILCGAWAVWSKRNARNHGERARTVSESVKWAADIATDLSISGRHKSLPKPRVRNKWKPPTEGIVKINVDASFSSSSGDKVLTYQCLRIVD